MRRWLLLVVLLCACRSREAKEVDNLEAELAKERAQCQSIGGQDGSLTCPTACWGTGAVCPAGFSCEDPDAEESPDGLTGVACLHEEISNCWACAASP